jgi:hypothetical protein
MQHFISSFILKDSAEKASVEIAALPGASVQALAAETREKMLRETAGIFYNT